MAPAHDYLICPTNIYVYPESKPQLRSSMEIYLRQYALMIRLYKVKIGHYQVILSQPSYYRLSITTNKKFVDLEKLLLQFILVFANVENQCGSSLKS